LFPVNLFDFEEAARAKLPRGDYDFIAGGAADGERGLKAMMGMLREELEIAMAFTGRPTIAEIDRSLVKLLPGRMATDAL